MISKEYSKVLKNCMTADPLLPRPNPTPSFWQDPPHPTVSNAQSSVLPQTTDFVVIGSGITGCSVTKALLESPSLSGKTITLLEARTLCSSATGRNGGHLVSDAPGEFASFAEILGKQKATEIARFSFKSMERTKEIIAGLEQGLREKVQLREVTSITGFGDSETFEAFKESLAMFEEALPEFKGRNEIAEQNEAIEKYGFRDIFGAELQHQAGALWPYRLITGIFETLLKEYSARFSIETSTPVLSISHSIDDAQYPYTLSTPRGTIHATKVIHCTNGHAAHLLPNLSGKIFPLRGTMSTQANGRSFPNYGATRSWSYMDKGAYNSETNIWSWTLYYITQDAVTGDIYIGGEKQKLDQLLVSDDTIIGSIPKAALSKVLPKIFRDAWDGEGKDPVVKSMWSGIMAFTSDALPLVGRLTENMSGRGGDGEWFAGGYNGHGMDKAWLTGEALVKMIAGEDVSTWFPSAYLISDKRLDEMDMDNVLSRLGGTE